MIFRAILCLLLFTSRVAVAGDGSLDRDAIRAARDSAPPPIAFISNRQMNTCIAWSNAAYWGGAIVTTASYGSALHLKEQLEAPEQFATRAEWERAGKRYSSWRTISYITLGLSLANYGASATYCYGLGGKKRRAWIREEAQRTTEEATEETQPSFFEDFVGQRGPVEPEEPRRHVFVDVRPFVAIGNRETPTFIGISGRL